MDAENKQQRNSKQKKEKIKTLGKLPFQPQNKKKEMQNFRQQIEFKSFIKDDCIHCLNVRFHSIMDTKLLTQFNFN